MCVCVCVCVGARARVGVSACVFVMNCLVTFAQMPNKVTGKYSIK